jgi:RpiR family carbohydrate utilization transcriptional regulator
MLVQIKALTPDLSRAEQRVARWVVDHPRQACRSTLAGIAMACGVSEPTVIRFCRHIGLDGFRDFTIRLAEDLSRPVSNVHNAVSADDKAPDAVTKVMDASIQSLIDMRSILSSLPIEPTLDAMASARQLAFAGLGASGHVASDACQKFFRLGTPCTALTNTPDILQFGGVSEPGDVMIIISHGGRWPELARAAELATERGATAIALTDRGSKLASVATIVFPCEGVEDPSVYTPMSSRLAHLALLDALQVALALVIGDTAVDKLRQSRRALQ